MQPNWQDKNGPNVFALGDYIRQVFKDKQHTSQVEQIFCGSTSPPILVRGRKNRILMYGGCFNPPHIGHLEQLIHCYRAGQAHLNVIAAVICLIKPHKIKKKDLQDPSEVLPENVRAKLWNQDPRFPQWAWILPEQWVGVTFFTDRLREESKKDGFDIDFLSVQGSDHYRYGRTHEFPSWGCFEYITSDISRYNYYIQRNALHRLTSFEEWEALPVEEDRKETPSETASDDSRDHVDMDIMTAGTDEDILWPCKREDIRICRLSANKSRVVYFVPKSKLVPVISSTRLRESLRRYVLEKTDNAPLVEALALSPKLLLKMWTSLNKTELDCEMPPASPSPSPSPSPLPDHRVPA